MKIVLDTNNMNAYGKNAALNYIEDCEKAGKVEIYYGADTLKDLRQDKSQNSMRLQKFHSKEVIASSMRFGYSTFPFKFARDPPLDDAIAQLIFGKKWRELVEENSNSMNSKIDVKLIEASILAKIDFFVTEDAKLLENAGAIKEDYGLSIINRENMKEILCDKKVI